MSEPSSGAFVAIVGPSGAGKDSLIAHARAVLSADPTFVFVRRVVTRKADSNAEDHDTLSSAEFAKANNSGKFAVTWEAHGLSYALPVSAEDHCKRGGVAIANCSRAALPLIAERFPHLKVVLVTAAQHILALRLAGRGRESANDIQQRLARQVDDFPGREQAEVIDNSFELEIAGNRLISILRGLVVQS